MKEFKFFPYQWRYLDDRSPSRCVLKSRRIGFSEVAAFRHAGRALGIRFRSSGAPERCRPVNQNIMSCSFDKSKELLVRVMGFVDGLIEGVPGSPRVIARSAAKVVLSNGVQLTALSTNPRTGRSGEGDLLLDEFANVPNQDAVWAAVGPMAGTTARDPEGFEVDIISTPLGDDNLFFQMCEGERQEAFSQHRITVHDAIRDGFPITPAKLKAMRAGFDRDTFSQEYECAFLSSAARYISADAYDACTFRPTDADFKALALQRPGRLFCGVDVAISQDLTALVRLRHDQHGIAWHDATEVFETRGEKAVLWEEQERWIDRQVANVSGIAVDATGLGDQFAQRLAIRYPGRVEEVDFTLSSKEALATTLKLALERRRVRVKASDDDLRREVLSLRREVTQHGNVRFDIKRTKGSHGDRAWALALALRASGTATRSAARPNPLLPSSLRRQGSPWREFRPRRGAWQ